MIPFLLVSVKIFASRPSGSFPYTAMVIGAGGRVTVVVVVLPQEQNNAAANIAMIDLGFMCGSDTE